MKRLALLLVLPALFACGQEGADSAGEEAAAAAGDCPEGYVANSSGMCTPVVPESE